MLRETDTVVEFLERALAFYAGLGIRPQRLQTDNAWTYIHNSALARLLRHHHYNRGRPHSEIGDRPPINRAPNLPGQDT